jgi:serine/threonine-protein kinase RsbW
MDDAFLVELVLAPKPELLRAARLVISSVAADLGFSMEEMEDLKLAVQEACGTRLSLGLVTGALRVTVSQSGADSLRVRVAGDMPGTGEPDDEASWGLDLARALVDDLAVEDSAGIEVLVLTKAANHGGRG